MSDMFSDDQTSQDSSLSSNQESGYESPSESASPSSPDDPHFEVPDVGRVPSSELVKGYLRQADYTRKTQALADRGRQYQQWDQEKQQYEQAMGQLREFLQDKQRISQYLAAMGGQVQEQAQAPSLDPNEILTAARAQELMTQRETLLQQSFQQRMEQMRQEIFTSSLENQYTESVNTKLRGLGEQYPELRQIPGMERLLREAVKSQNPTSIEQALGLFDQAASFYMKTLDGLAQKRVAQVQKTPLARGIEPPNGAAPAPRPDSTASYAGVRDPRLRNQVVQDIMRIMSSGG